MRLILLALFLLFLLFLVGVNGCSRSAPSPPPPPPRLSIATYNMDVGITPDTKAIEAILATKADVLCLQEVNPKWHQFLAKELTRQYPYLLYHENDYGQALLSKRPMRDVAYIQPAGGAWFPAWLVEIDTAAGPVQIVNMHLRPNLSDRNNPITGYFEAQVVHQREIQAIKAKLNPDAPVIFAGDFNENDGPAIRDLEAEGYHSALAQFDKTSPTFHGHFHGVPLTSRTDHILTTSHFRCTAARVVHEGASDHYPVVADLELIEPTTAPTTRPTR